MKQFMKIAVATVLTLALGYWLSLRFPQMGKNVGVRDSIAYWAAGELLAAHHDPYDQRAVLGMEREWGYKDQRPLVLRTPPWSLFLVWPLGLVGPFGAWVAWIVTCLTCLVIGMRLCAKMYGAETPSNLLTVVGYTFAPVAACLVSGQMGLVLMIGLVLFLWWEKERPLLAGAALILPFAKPHLTSAFWLILLLWVAHRRRTRVAIGFLIAFGVATMSALILDPQIFEHYRNMLHASAINREFIPAISGVLRLLFFRRFFWLQLVPMFAGLLWSVTFFVKNAPEWDWQRYGPALLVVSVLTTPYEWLSDETVLLPAILQATALVYSARHTLKLGSKVALVVFALSNLLLLLILKSKIPFSTGIYFWSSLVWFLWYFRARKWHSQRSTPQERQLVTQPLS